MEFCLGETKEVVIVGPKRNDLEQEVLSSYLPDAVIVLSTDPIGDSEAVPLLKDRTMIDGKPAAYVCKDFVCSRPVSEIQDLKALLG